MNLRLPPTLKALASQQAKRRWLHRRVRHHRRRNIRSADTAEVIKATGFQGRSRWETSVKTVVARGLKPMVSNDDAERPKLCRRVGRRKATMNTKTQSPHPVGSSAWLAVLPFHVNAHGFVEDATGSQVLVCSEDTDCTLRFSEREVDKDGHFMCPNCGRLGQRMVEATPEQCGMTANSD